VHFQEIHLSEAPSRNCLPQHAFQGKDHSKSPVHENNSFLNKIEKTNIVKKVCGTTEVVKATIQSTIKRSYHLQLDSDRKYIKELKQSKEVPIRKNCNISFY
jgi:hypothetical protein